jgi:hypothetical protein
MHEAGSWGKGMWRSGTFLGGWIRVDGFVEIGGCGGLPSQALDLTLHLRTSKGGFSRLTCLLLVHGYIDLCIQGIFLF